MTATDIAADLKGEEIPLEARIIAIAEAFDAMTSPLSYKVPMSIGLLLLTSLERSQDPSSIRDW